jgi:hypothetical protein
MKKRGVSYAGRVEIRMSGRKKHRRGILSNRRVMHGSPLFDMSGIAGAQRSIQFICCKRVGVHARIDLHRPVMLASVVEAAPSRCFPVTILRMRKGLATLSAAKTAKAIPCCLWRLINVAETFCLPCISRTGIDVRCLDSGGCLDPPGYK